ncbi:hypothetical protein BC938DRAFT_482816 [Jimgerdemannia flammicorona]|uniref:Uncharacterized protein n=1 Tax=Jimgerdemannia flammicorona TaxID=994334 RepID=A0A433QD94_9FUNG|nr:hypothetical protein BC938DRAFT_482816 [Jimgerdemannia flammicorona]
MGYVLLSIAKKDKRLLKKSKTLKKKIKEEKPPVDKVQCLNASNFKNNDKWVLEILYEAINDLLKGYASNFAVKHKIFQMKFHSKKDYQ